MIVSSINYQFQIVAQLKYVKMEESKKPTSEECWEQMINKQN